MNLREQYVTAAKVDGIARGPTGSSANMKRIVAAIASSAVALSAFDMMACVADGQMSAGDRDGGLGEHAQNMLGKQLAVAAVKKMLAAGDRVNGGWSKKMIAEQPELAGLKKTTEATPLACLEKIGSAMRRTMRHLDTGEPVALAISSA